MNEPSERLVGVPVEEATLEGALAIPAGARALVLFAHGSGSGRHSPRNNFVARVLRGAGLGTFLFDLLTEEEDRTYEDRFDLVLLASRLREVTDWVRARPEARDLAIGYFGASTGAAAALKAAAELGPAIGAVVSRGGRPDLAKDYLARVEAPTLLIVGGEDHIVIELNEQALRLLRAPRKLSVIPGATHLFEEPGTLEEVAHQATAWFAEHLLGALLQRAAYGAEEIGD